LEFVPHKGENLREAFVVAFCSNKTSRQFTVHHPIGVTDLNDFDWVVTPTEEIDELIDRAKDPSYSRLVELRKQFRQRAAVEKGLVKVDPNNGHLIFPKCGEDRDVLMSFCREQADKSIEGDIVKWRKSYEKLPEGTAKPPKPTPPDVLTFFKEDVAQEERALRKFLNDPILMKAAEEEYPQTFRTRHGPLQDRDQTRINDEGKVLTQYEMFDKMINRFVTGSYSGGVEPPGKPKKIAWDHVPAGFQAAFEKDTDSKGAMVEETGKFPKPPGSPPPEKRVAMPPAVPPPLKGAEKAGNGGRE
jgi:hypothetical protein